MLALLIKASIVIIVLLGFYKVFLQKESFFTANRIYLLSCLAFACILPFIVLPKLIEQQGCVTSLLDTFREQETKSTETDMGAIENSIVVEEPRISTSIESNSKQTTLPTTNTNSSSKINTPTIEQTSSSKRTGDAITISNNSTLNRGIAYWLVVLYFFGATVFLLRFLAQIIMMIRS